METKYSWHSFWAYCFCFVFFSFLAVHFAHMKAAPGQDRYVASSHQVPKPFYDASFKL